MTKQDIDRLHELEDLDADGVQLSVITSTALALKLTMILDRSKRIAGESIKSGAAAVLNAYTGALRTEFEHLIDDLENGE